MSSLQRLAPWLLSGCVAGCVALPDVPAGVCGNGVVEPDNGEQCDLFADAKNGQRCGAPTDSDENRRCHYLCSSTSECPTDPPMSCGTDGICHLGSGSYAEWRTPIAHQAHALQLGDLDGDGRADLLALETPALNPDWQSQPTITFFDENGTQAGQAFDLQTGIRSPMLAPIVKASHAARPQRQLVMGTSFGIATLLANSERRFFSLPYPFQTLPANTKYRMIPVRGVTGTPMHATVLIYLSDGAQTHLLDGATGVGLGLFDHSVDELSSDPVAGRLDGRATSSPCDEVVLAYRGIADIFAHRFCDTTGNLLASNAVPRTIASLPAGHTAGSQLMLVDVDADEHLDLLVADTNGCPFLAFGHGDGTFSADLDAPATTSGTLWPVVTTSSECPDFPLAVGDLNESDRPDWVLPTGVALVTSLQPDTDQSRIEIATQPGNAPFMHRWTVARIAQLNGDNHLDLVAGSDQYSGLDLLIGTGQERLNPTVVQSEGPVAKLVTGDYDGDGRGDIAFIQNHPTDDIRPQSLAVAYSTLTTGPAVATEIAALPAVAQLTTGDYETDDAMAEIGVLTQALGQTQLTLFVGNRGQCPVASLGLWRPDDEVNQSDNSSDGMYRAGPPIALIAGHFVSAETASFFVFAKDTYPGENCLNRYRIWFAPDAEVGALKEPSPQLDAPELAFSCNAASDVPAYFVAGDLNTADDVATGALDDALLLTSGPDESHVSLWRVNLPLSGGPLTRLFATEGRLMPNSSPILVDLDGDKRLDLVLMLGGATDEQTRLFVFWNDNGAPNSGTLENWTAKRIELPDGKPVRGFAKREDPETPGLFILSDDAVYVIERDEGVQHPRDLSPQGPLSIDTTFGDPLSAASAIAVGDMTGDGLVDVALAVHGSIRIFKQLEQVAP